MQNFLINEKLLRHIEWTNGILLIIFILGGWVIYSTNIALSIFLGGAISTLSFQVLKWQLTRAFQNPYKRLPSKGGLFASYYVRYIGTLFVVFTVMYYGWANPIAFLVGLSVVVLSIVVAGGREFLVMSEQKGDS